MKTSKLIIPSAKPAKPAAPAEREPEKYWVNIGYSVEMVDESTGESRVGFVSLPYGIPLSSVQPEKMTNSAKMNALLGAKNDLLEQFKAAAEALEPGEVRTLQLEVQIRHVGEKVIVESDENPFIKNVFE